MRAGVRSSCRIAKGRSILVIPWKKRRIKGHPELVTVTNKDDCTCSKLFQKQAKSERETVID